MDLDQVDDTDEFCQDDRPGIQCMFVGVADLQSKTQKPNNVSKDKNVAEIAAFLKKKYSLSQSDTIVRYMLL